MGMECRDLRQFVRLIQSPAIYRVSASSREEAFAYPQDEHFQFDFCLKMKPGEYDLLVTVLIAFGYKHTPLWPGDPECENRRNWQRPGTMPIDWLMP